MPVLATYRLLAGVVVVGFVVRYIVKERRLRQRQNQAIVNETRKRVAPWRDWAAWRRNIIEQEFAESG